MLYVEIDYHKRYSQVNAIDEKEDLGLPSEFAGDRTGELKV